jgi:malate dehydrogenase (oxaloacetate-decarboxylating)(NADP+)
MDLATLRGLKPLGALSDGELRRLLALGTERNFAAGEKFIEEDSAGACFYILLSGNVDVTKDGRHVAALGPGAFIGEMALFNNNIRVSSAVAVEPIRLLEIPTSVFWPLVLHHDLAAVKVMEALGHIMTERLQLQDETLVQHIGENDPELASAVSSFAPVKQQLMADWALKYHSIGKPGKLGIVATKPAGTAADLSVAYSPGVAEPCLAISRDPLKSFDYTARGHLVGVITNGTAVLGLGNIGALAAKPVMEGKAILFKRFADIDAFDIELDETDPERFIDMVCALAPTFGGINLEDIRSPECFHIEQECRRRLDIPVLHDDQHGTAIICGAALLNVLEFAGKRIDEVRVVFSGAGAAGFSCARHFLALGVARENLVLTDARGVVYRGRGDGNYLDELAAETDWRTLAEAIAGADVFVGVSVAGVLKPEMLKSMNRDPAVFAMANPVPEIDYATALRTRADVIMGTGRSDYPNQINNVSAFPYLFRGALDVRATDINEAMKLAATRAIAVLAREPVTPEAGFDGAGLSFGRRYLLPKPFDRRLLVEVSAAVAEAAMQSGAARQAVDPAEYRRRLAAWSQTAALSSAV